MMKKGFTLTEILVYIGVLAIIILAASSFFLWVTNVNSKNKAEREVADNIRRVMEVMNYEIKEASAIYTPTSRFSTTSGQLSLETTNNLSAGETKTYIDFYLCGTQLCLKKESQNPIAITNSHVKVTGLTFEQIAATSTTPSIRINLKIDYATPSSRPEYQASFNATSAISLRVY